MGLQRLYVGCCQMRRIERLPEDIHGSVRSGVVISDFSRIVEELVFNSVEAGATKVFVAVGVSSGYVKVVDNGCGIARDGLVLLGERYATSKVAHMDLIDTGSEYFEIHGESLCSISDISLLEIVTKARGKPNGYKKIMKNCRCLFLGINDDRQDVGTTVTVRDIFYNQPVRRKHMESSPKKVLDSIKMSVLRIALVHLNVLFRVVDVESTDELLHTGPSTSPLPILINNFGIENAGDLCKLNVADGLMELSGYISDPRESFSLKGIQYFYINSRFIGKGPIHKLLNQLAMKFELANCWKPTSGSQTDKRNRCQIGPAFVLNLTCPKSYYDILALERSRTSVEFKDWRPVLALIENGVMRLWDRKIPHENSMSATSGHGKKRCRNYNGQTSLDLGSPELKKLPKNYDNMPVWEECLSLREELSSISDLKKHQGECFLADTDYVSRSCDQSLVGCQNTVEELHSHLSPCCDFPLEHHDFVEHSSGELEDGISSSALVDILPKFGNEMNNISIGNVVSDDTSVNQDLKKSFLRRCSFQRSFVDDRTPQRTDEIFEFGSSNFRITKNWRQYNESFLDEVDLGFGGKDMQGDGGPSFQCSPLNQYAHERSEYIMEDSIRSPLAYRNIMADSPQQVLKCSSSQRSFSPGWYHDDDIVGKSLIESCSEFDEDTINVFSTWRKDQDLIDSCLSTRDRSKSYSTWRKDSVPIGCNLNTEECWQQQSGSFMNFSPDHKDCTYNKIDVSEVHWNDFETSFSPIPFKKYCDSDWSPLTYYGKESPKKYLVPSLVDTFRVVHECRRPGSRNPQTLPNRKKSSIRSHSAPPFYKGKKRFLDLSLSVKNSVHDVGVKLISPEPSSSSSMQFHVNSRNLKLSENALGQQYNTCRMERSPADWSFAKRPSLERASEVISIKDNSPEKKDHRVEPVQSGNDQVKDSSDEDLNEMLEPFDSRGKWRNYCSPIAGGIAACNNNDQETILDISSDILNLAGNSLIPKSIDKTSLEDAKVLNQVDKKFIAVVARRSLAVIDQHAADERIRLEELRHKVLSGEMKSITYLEDEQELVLPEIGYQLLHNYAEQIQKWGWICNIHSKNTSSFTKNLDFLHRQPTVVKLLAVPCILGVNLTDIDLLEFLQQLADTDGSSAIPPSVHSILNNKACRGAIMFGDTLLPSECSLIVEELTRTSLCFQCAHGRPTTVPLVNLDVLHSKIAKLCSDRSWHGLYQHEIKLERTKQRLSSALS